MEALVLGVVQGLTEWLPVSSSGHLAVAQHRFGQVPIAVDILLHVGTMLVLVAFFRRDVASLARAAAGILGDVSRGTSWRAAAGRTPERRLALLILAAMVPTAALALLFRHALGNGLFSNLALVAAGFAVTGVLLLLTGLGKPGNRDAGRLQVVDALAVGAAQGVAFLPGFSRSGLTIGTGLLRGIESETAGRFSFLMMVPAVLGAMLLQLPELGALDEGMIWAGLLGMLVAMVVGYASLGLLMRVLRAKKLHYFAPYCLLAFVVTLGIWAGAF